MSEYHAEHAARGGGEVLAVERDGLAARDVPDIGRDGVHDRNGRAALHNRPSGAPEAVTVGLIRSCNSRRYPTRESGLG